MSNLKSRYFSEGLAPCPRLTKVQLKWSNLLLGWIHSSHLVLYTKNRNHRRICVTRATDVTILLYIIMHTYTYLPHTLTHTHTHTHTHTQANTHTQHTQHIHTYIYLFIYLFFYLYNIYCIYIYTYIICKTPDLW